MTKDDTMSERVVRAIFGGLLLASVFALGIVKVEDTDTWTHLALGRDIVQHQGFPATEQFNFPSLDLPYDNSEWLFGLVFYLAYFLAGIPGVILLKASIVTLAFFILFKDSLIPRDPPSHRFLGKVVATLVLFLIFLVVRYRVVERPDIALMVFLGFTIYALNAYIWEGKKRYLYLLPVVQVLWVNMHPSIVVGIVPYMAFLFGGLLQRLLLVRLKIELPGTPSGSQLRTIAMVFAALLAAALLNPYGMSPFLAPFHFAGSRWLMDEIVELQRTGLSEFYGAPVIIVASLALMFVLTLKRLSLISLLLVGPFIYLGLSAQRFFFLLAIVAAPIIIRHLRKLLGRIKVSWAYRMSLPAGLIAASLVVVLTGLFLMDEDYFVDLHRIPGFGIYYDNTPEGALRYLDRIGMTGKVYNTFEWGGYIVWRDHKRRIPIIDGRGRVPNDLREAIPEARYNPKLMAQLQSKYDFDVAVLKYPGGIEEFGMETPGFDVGLTSPDWALVYWDDFSLVYLRRGTKFEKIIEAHGYRYVKPANGLDELERKLNDKSMIAPLEAELRRNIAETQASSAYMFLGKLYNSVGAYEMAIDALSHVRHNPLRSYIQTAYLGLGFAYDKMGSTDRALVYYKKAARLKERPMILYNIGTALEKMGHDLDAIDYLERAVEKDRNLTAAYPPLARAYRRMGMTEKLQKIEAALRQATVNKMAEQHFRRGVKFYIEHKRSEAMIAFQESLRLNPRNADALSNLGYLYFDLGHLDEALTMQKRALELNPKHTNSHYGLALIYVARGEPAKAREHLEEYLRLEPRGYWSRKATEMLSQIP